MCWLALLLIRITETTTGVTWAKTAGELSLLTLGTFTGPAGAFRQTAELTKTQRDLLAKLKSRTRRRTSRQPRQPSDQQRYHRLVTRPSPARNSFSQLRLWIRAPRPDHICGTHAEPVQRWAVPGRVTGLEPAPSSPCSQSWVDRPRSNQIQAALVAACGVLPLS